ncbi:pyrroline-5-carboxylate reductase [Stieleria sp. ICT_E10.1]|uniref:pyrroline-5-carboxylate reductase n=1 Tax=Stieleria sedimenti TaxID=2976331 RepID=UPI00217F922E|nr:pyrroline-5-carboxylate reductase [Stieleria sedimenti]MCS7465556.1 pyrroline-5-carboxylate reductase [Stieleria sedimenti]
MNKATVVVIGGGQMGRALVGGMLASGFAAADRITIVDPSPDSRQWWADQHPAVGCLDQMGDDADQADVFLLAVKPHLIPQVAAEIANRVEHTKLIVSIAAGVSLTTLCEHAGHERVIRVMPNTPSLVGAGASAFCVAAGATDDDCRWIEQALAGVGTVARVAEAQMDAVTGLSGSGPAYICLVIEALADGGVLAGLPRPLAMTLAAQTVLGTAKMVAETGRHPAELKDAVASPGGTTIAALKVLEERGLRAALINAVEASAKRSGELG